MTNPNLNPNLRTMADKTDKPPTSGEPPSGPEVGRFLDVAASWSLENEDPKDLTDPLTSFLTTYPPSKKVSPYTPWKEGRKIFERR